uniref:Bifunctional glutamate/proline--tRNA ligase n=1 Tax=Diabrotica virgifera virgifera TaxID=50390 RepID=A0A6P7FFN4_DIAVI
MKITVNKSSPPLGGLFLAEYVKLVKSIPLEISWGSETVVENTSCKNSNDVARTIARSFCPELYGSSALETTEVDNWLTLSLGPLNNRSEVTGVLETLNKVLGSVTYLVAKRITVADFIVFGSLYTNKHWNDLTKSKSAPVNVVRWYDFLHAQEAVMNILNNLPQDVAASLTQAEKQVSQEKNTNIGNRNQEGKFVDLPFAQMGKVIVRFPPEASGYLHIGHAKAALLNQHYQEAFQGKLILRFDDTNPAKENVHFENVILEDVAMLQIKPDIFTYTSDYFELMLELCEKMMKEGNAYVDDTEPEEMKTQREQKIESVNRNNDVQKNFAMWEEMKKGTEKGQKCCVRAKMFMDSPNGCLRDPTIYRCKNELHPRTGSKYKVYPTYDFACPIVDAIEGVTHVLRTMEYHDRDHQFYWFIEKLGLRKPHIWEYSRLSMTNTVLSKRKLTWFVNEGQVDGWDDPRMPTVRGVLRRGMTVQGLKEFIIAQGSSRSVVFMEWDKIWSFNKKVIDPIAPRYTAVDVNDPVPVLVKGVKEECLSVPKHPKNAEVGNKSTWLGPKILIDRVDAEALKEGENTTFINWGNLMITKINRQNGNIVNVEAQPNLQDTNFKKTLKLTWLAETDKAPFTPTWCVYFDHIISKAVLGKDEDFKQFIGHQTKKEVEMLGDPELRNLQVGDIIQLQRRGFFRVDVAYKPANLHTYKEQPVILFHIPDGSAKESIPGQAVAKSKTNVAPKADSKVTSKSATYLNNEIIKQGDAVRKLKEQKAAKADIDTAVKVLLTLKAEYKAVANTDWKPGCVPPTASVSKNDSAIGDEINAKIAAQGEKVRQLKSQKADKAAVEAEVRQLLSLKAEYKSATGKDWTPSQASSTNKITNQTSSTTKPKQENVSLDENSILQQIALQGEKVRTLKSQKADKSTVDHEVKALLSLKADYKTLTGKDWKPGAVAAPPSLNTSTSSASANVTVDENSLLLDISSQGDVVRKLKSEKADKSQVDVEVKKLLNLKENFKNLTGKDWKPNMKPEPAVPNNQNVSAGGDNAKEVLTAKITDQGNLVRDLKTQKADKEKVDAAVKVLLALKVEYKNLTGTDFPVAGRTPKETKPAAPKEKVVKQKPAAKEKKPEVVEANDSGAKKQTRLGLEAKKEEQLSDWYSQVITKGELIEYYDVSGCYIFRPWSFAIWEAIKDWFDGEIKKLGVQNCYFPIFVSKAALEKEKTHIEDFAPEVAWVTKSGDSDMAEPIAVRPTSETVMYPAYAKWIQSYRDLPIKLNQWNNVVRWEFKHPQPFLRTREFLWQEGHTAFALKEEADVEVRQILDLYARVYTDLLAIPVVKGRKTEKEKFAGGDYTLTVEAYVSASGRAIQGATSHHLGQNFSKMFDITYEHPDSQEKTHVYQNSWGITTRTIGVVVMIHGDNQGLVIPPRVAAIQTVIVPCGITANLSEDSRKKLQSSCDALEADLKAANVRVKGDYRDNYSPGWKFNHWELKGVPVRIELGPKDIEKNQLVAVRRDTGEKITISRADAVTKLGAILEDVHANLYKKACDDLESHKVLLKDWSQFCPSLDKRNIILAPFCGEVQCEDKIKADSTRDAGENAEPGAPSMGAKSLCIPLEQPADIKPSDKCIHPDCKNKPKYYTLFGRSY